MLWELQSKVCNTKHYKQFNKPYMFNNKKAAFTVHALV